MNTRLALVFAAAHEGTFAIDSWHDDGPLATMDKAFHNGHYYSDKVFGISLLALPVAKLLDIPSAADFQLQHYLLRLSAVGLPAALSVGLFFRLAVALGAPARRALFLTLAAFLGTLWHGYATIFMPYGPGVLCTLATLWLLLFGASPGDHPVAAAPPPAPVTPAVGGAVGFLAGFALLCDFTFAIALAALGAVYLAVTIRQAACVGWGRGFLAPSLAATAAGALPIGLYAAYTHHIFGTFSIPYHHSANTMFLEGMSRGILGVTRPRLDVLYFITVHPFRGVFFWSPIVLVAVVGALATLRRDLSPRTLAAAAGLVSFAGYLAANSGYYMWWGGWSVGARFLIPGVVMLLAGMAPALAGRAAWIAALVTGAVSIALSLPLALVDPQLPQGNTHEAITAATWGSHLAVPQWQALGAFYSARVTLLLPDRLAGTIGAASALRGLLGVLLFIAAVALPAALAWRRLAPPPPTPSA